MCTFLLLYVAFNKETDEQTDREQDKAVKDLAELLFQTRSLRGRKHLNSIFTREEASQLDPLTLVTFNSDPVNHRGHNYQGRHHRWHGVDG